MTRNRCKRRARAVDSSLPTMTRGKPGCLKHRPEQSQYRKPSNYSHGSNSKVDDHHSHKSQRAGSSSLRNTSSALLRSCTSPDLSIPWPTKLTDKRPAENGASPVKPRRKAAQTTFLGTAVTAGDAPTGYLYRNCMGWDERELRSSAGDSQPDQRKA